MGQKKKKIVDETNNRHNIIFVFEITENLSRNWQNLIKQFFFIKCSKIIKNNNLFKIH